MDASLCMRACRLALPGRRCAPFLSRRPCLHARCCSTCLPLALTPAVKRLIGKEFEDVEGEVGRLAYTVKPDEDGFAVLDCPNLEGGAGWARQLPAALPHCCMQGCDDSGSALLCGLLVWAVAQTCYCAWLFLCGVAVCTQVHRMLCRFGNLPRCVRIRHLFAPGGQLYPEEVSGYGVGKLLSAAEEFAGRPVSKAVISVPAYFTDAQVGNEARGCWEMDGNVCSWQLQRGPRHGSAPITQRPVLPSAAAACLQKEATVTAGRIAGLEAVRIIRCASCSHMCCKQALGGNHDATLMLAYAELQLQYSWPAWPADWSAQVPRLAT